MELISTDLLRKSLDPLPLYTIGHAVSLCWRKSTLTRIRPQIDLHNWNAQSPAVRKNWPAADRAIMDFLDTQLSTSGLRSTVYFW